MASVGVKLDLINNLNRVFDYSTLNFKTRPTELDIGEMIHSMMPSCLTGMTALPTAETSSEDIETDIDNLQDFADLPEHDDVLVSAASIERVGAIVSSSL